ncbi:MAG: alpha-L-fucosidase [Clostridiales bacterium]|nr:alpha-L-fucosidase [Clostridiales bacterium]
MKKFSISFVVMLTMLISGFSSSSAKSLHELQQDFVDLKFGLFVHFGMGTYLDNDWADPDAPLSLFNPTKLDCNQWIKGAKSANMNFVCMSVKHHNGFCLWDSKTTDYTAVNSAVHRDVVKELTDALQKENMKVMFHFSILDLHEKILPNRIHPYHIDFIKNQLRELLTNYGPVTALMIDGWDAPWSRISYDDISFDEIYKFCKSIQPDCLVMDLNGAKYPAEGLFYSDIKTYEQGAGQRIQSDTSFLPSMACYQLQDTWFWKSYFPDKETRSPETLVNNNLVPMNKVGCTFILNAAPNTDGLIDDNAMASLKKIGKIWRNTGHEANVAETGHPITASNIAKGCHVTGSWSFDMGIHDLVTDDDFGSAWYSNPAVKEPWISVELGETQPLNMVVITCHKDSRLDKYSIEYRTGGEWKTLFDGNAPTDRRVKTHRFDRVYADAVRLRTTANDKPLIINEIGVYNEE